MNDRELLELAAKAAGLELGKWDEQMQAFDTPRVDGIPIWNALTSDRDAMRLMVKLRMMVSVFGADVRVDHGGRFFHENGGSSLYAATRRAIVRAAAETGRAM